MGFGQGRGAAGSVCPGLLWSFMWLLTLFFFAWPLAGLLAGMYIILLPFSVCIPPLKPVCDSLLAVLNFPYQCAERLVTMTPMC
ncbi:hypothetical protein ACOMHN_010375 [Nucella lapillus]